MFEALFTDTRVIDTVKAQQALQKLFDAITESSSIKKGYQLISFYKKLDFMILCSGKDVKEIVSLEKIKTAVMAQINLIDDYSEIALFADLFQFRAKRFHEAKKLHCPLSLHPDIIDAMC